MAASVASIKLYFFDEANPVDLLASPFSLDDGGFELGEVERDLYSYSIGNYASFFSGGFSYKPRNVVLRLTINSFGNSEVARLYKQIERLNNMSRFVEHPIMSLYFRLAGDGVSVEQGGYMKVLSAEIATSSEIFSVARIHQQSVLGQPVTLNLVCEPFIYEKNMVKNEFIQLTVGSANGSGGYTYATTGSINTSNAYNPHFSIRGSDVRGDVPSPISIKLKNNYNNAARIGSIFMGTNYGLNYPGYVGTGNTTVDYKTLWNTNTTNNQFANGNTIEYRYAGKCAAFLVSVNPPVVNDLVRVEIKYQSLTVVDSIDYYNTSAGGMFYIGTLTVPFSGRTTTNNYTLHITSSDSTDWNVILIPAWNMRGYVASGYNLPYNDFLYDNQMDNTLFTGTGGAYYNKIGEGILAIPGVDLRGMMVAISGTGSKWIGNMGVTFYYNPRYLYVRDIL